MIPVPSKCTMQSKLDIAALMALVVRDNLFYFLRFASILNLLEISCGNRCCEVDFNGHGHRKHQDECAVEGDGMSLVSASVAGPNSSRG